MMHLHVLDALQTSFWSKLSHSRLPHKRLPLSVTSISQQMGDQSTR